MERFSKRGKTYHVEYSGDYTDNVYMRQKASDLKDRMAVMSELPDSLVMKSLIRLPVKSLMQCICVCKSWYNLVSDPHFIRSHLSQPSADEKEYLATGFRRDIFVIDHYSFRGNETLVEKAKVNPLFQSEVGSMLAGCCSGLLLMLNLNTYDSDMYLWNPSLGKFKFLSSAHDTYKNKLDLVGLGLAFLPDVCDYKVIRILNFLSDDLSVAEIYSLRTDSWRRIETPVMRFIPVYDCPLSAAFVNPFFYWVGKSHDKYCNDFIVSFNVKCETFKATSLPDACLNDGGLEGHLAVFQESLYLFAFRFNEGWSLWMMKENCGSGISWLKKCTFHYRGRSPGGFMKNGDVIMDDAENKVSLHDPRDGSSPGNIEYEIKWGPRSSEVCNYSPSLALLDQYK